MAKICKAKRLDHISHQIGCMSLANDHPLSVHSILSKISMPLIVGKFLFSKKDENLTKLRRLLSKDSTF